MKNYSIAICSVVFIFLSAANVMGSSDDFFAVDSDAVYDKDYPTLNLVIEIPGYKLDPMSALALGVEKEDRDRAKDFDPEILEKVKKYIGDEGGSKEESEYYLFAVKDLGDYILLYFSQPEIADGGFEFVYSKKLKKIIGQFSAGYKG